MKAISLWQPWATAIAVGAKAVETRHWQAPVRGLIAIHAAKRWTHDEREFTEDMRALGFPLPDVLPLGAIVATALLERVVRTEDLRDQLTPRERLWGNYADGRFGWVLGDVRPIAEPVPCRGFQSFFELDHDVNDAVLRQSAPIAPPPRPNPHVHHGAKLPDGSMA